MTEVEQQLIASLNRQEQLLQELIASINKPKLGLHSDAGMVFIYCNRSNGSLWYTLDSNRQPRAISQSALTGYLKVLRFEKVKRRGKQCHKLIAVVEADRLYQLESGHDSHFSKGLLSAVASLTPQHLRCPITIEPQPGSDDSVLFCRLWFGSHLVKAPYGEATSWRDVAVKAIANCKAANQ